MLRLFTAFIQDIVFIEKNNIDYLFLEKYLIN